MLEAIKRRVGREGLRNVEYVQGSLDGVDPRLPAGRLDAVLIVDAYHEVANPIALLRNVGASLNRHRPDRHRRFHARRRRPWSAAESAEESRKA